MFKKVIFSILLLFLIVFSWLWFAIQPGIGDPTYNPNVMFHYDNRIDRYLCPTEVQTSINDTWLIELKQRLPELNQKWQEVGPHLLAATTQLIGKPFRHNSYDIPVFLCSAIPGFGLPLVVPVNLYLNAPGKDKKWSDEEFVGAVYHELLHLYVAHALNWNLWTPLLKKYKSEAAYTKIHVHLYAIQAKVYKLLGMEREWEITVLRAKTFPAAYSRAIKIIEAEGPEPFLDELKK